MTQLENRDPIWKTVTLFEIPWPIWKTVSNLKNRDPFEKQWPIWKIVTNLKTRDPFEKSWLIWKIVTHLKNRDPFEKSCVSDTYTKYIKWFFLTFRKVFLEEIKRGAKSFFFRKNKGGKDFF